jgi:hypothetical protein
VLLQGLDPRGGDRYPAGGFERRRHSVLIVKIMLSSVNGLSFFLSLSPSINYSEKGHKEKAAGLEPTALSTSGVS